MDRASELLQRLQELLPAHLLAGVGGSVDYLSPVADTLSAEGVLPLQLRKEMASLCAYLAMDPLGFYEAASMATVNAAAKVQSVLNALSPLTDERDGILRWSPLSTLLNSYPDPEVIRNLQLRIRRARLARSEVTETVDSGILRDVAEAQEQLAAYLAFDPNRAGQLSTASSLQLVFELLQEAETALDTVASLQSKYDRANFSASVYGNVLAQSEIALDLPLARLAAGDSGDEVTLRALAVASSLYAVLTQIQQPLQLFGVLITPDARLEALQPDTLPSVNLRSCPSRVLGSGRSVQAILSETAGNWKATPTGTSWFSSPAPELTPVRHLRLLGEADSVETLELYGSATISSSIVTRKYVVDFNTVSQVLTLSAGSSLTLPAYIRLGSPTEGIVLWATLTPGPDMYYIAGATSISGDVVPVSDAFGYIGEQAVSLVQPEIVQGINVALGTQRRSGRRLLLEVASGYASASSFELVDTGAIITDARGPYAAYVAFNSIVVDPDASFSVWALGEFSEGSNDVALVSPIPDLETLQSLLSGVSVQIAEQEYTVSEVFLRPQVGSQASLIVLRVDRPLMVTSEPVYVIQDQRGTHFSGNASNTVRAGDHILTDTESEHLVLATSGPLITVAPPILETAARVNRDAWVGYILFDDQAECGWEITRVTSQGWDVRLAFGDAQNGSRDLRVGPTGSDYTSTYDIYAQDRETVVTLPELDTLARPFVPASSLSSASDEGWSFSISGEMSRTERIGMSKIGLSIPAVRPYQWKEARPAVASGIGSKLATLTILEQVTNRAGTPIPVPAVGAGGVLHSLTSRTTWEIVEGGASGPVLLRAPLRGTAQGPITIGGHSLFGYWAYVQYRVYSRARAQTFNVAEMRDDLGRSLSNLGQGGTNLGSASITVSADRNIVTITTDIDPLVLLGCDLETTLVLNTEYVPMRVREVISSAGSTHVVRIASAAPDTVPANTIIPVEVVRTVIASAWSEVTALVQYLESMLRTLELFQFSEPRRISEVATQLRESRFELAAKTVDDLDFEAWVSPYAMSAARLDVTSSVETVLAALQRNRESPL